MMKRSKDLLQLENKYASSQLESALLVCKKDSQSETKKPPLDGKPFTDSLPQSQVLGKVKDFLGVISEANKRLKLEAKDNSQEHDIEALTGNESEIIEMDLMLGVADLQTPEAVAAAESSISGYQPVISLASSSTGTESEDSGDDNDDDDNHEKADNYDEPSFSKKLKSSKSVETNSLNQPSGNKSRNRSKIVELP